MPVLTRLIPSPVVVDIRPGALDDLVGVLADERISHSGKLAFAVSGCSGYRLLVRLGPNLHGANCYDVCVCTRD
ncbi:dehydrogenase, partial [Streptomyces sp. NPDC058964]